VLYNTGARVSEIIGVRFDDVVLDGAVCVHLQHGKGRKQRAVPLWKNTVSELCGRLPRVGSRRGSATTGDHLR